MFVTNCVSIDARVTREARSLVEAGHDVTVMGLREPGQPRSERFDGFEIRRVRVDALHEPRRGFLRRVIAPFVLAWTLLDYWGRAFRAAVRGRFDVFHAHDLITLPVAWAARRIRGGRLVYDAHELFTEIGRLGPFARRAFQALERALIGRVDRVITVNDSIAAELVRRYGIDPPLVLRNCPRTGGRRPERSRSELRTRAGLPADVAIVLYQGLYMPNRGLENLIRAARSFLRAHLVLLGWGPLQRELEELVAREGLGDRVSFVAPVPISELLAMTAGADLGVIPYRNVGLNNFYTSPNKLFDYCAAGVPVVASSFPELEKIVIGLGYGRTFDPDDPASIADAVNGLLGDPAELESVRQRIAKGGGRFTWEVESGKLLDAYASLPFPA
jgi:glycosyltransferase involved in cell wall biosynthesis